MEDYTPNVNALVKKHGGVYLARTMTMERVEGDRALPGAFAIIEWALEGGGAGLFTAIRN